MQVISMLWNQLDDDAKKPYDDAYKRDKKAYDQELL
jgi:hypothetical protein